MEEIAFGRYRLIALIGQGGMGKVYRAHDTVLGRDVALKVLPPELAAEGDYQQRFRREAMTAARLNEPHVIPIFDSGEIDGRLYLVMPIIEGTDVQTLLARDGPMSPQRAVQVVEQLAAALSAAHRHGLVHRDVKPSNALVTGDDFVYLIDFGIVQDVGASRLTSTGMMVGTLAYMAPERFTAGSADARSDVYALACVLYECLTGSTPYPGDSLEQQIAGHLASPPPRPTQRRHGLAAGFDEVIAAGMAKAPEQRYQSARDLARAARRALTEKMPQQQHFAPPIPPTVPMPPTPPTVPAPRPLPPEPRQSRAAPITMMAASLVIVAALVAVIGYLALRPADSAAPTSAAQPASLPAAQPAPSAAPPSAPPPGIAGLTPFVGMWQSHTQRLVVDTSGAGHFSYRGCWACPTPTDNTVDFTLTSVTNGMAHGNVTDTSDSYYAGKAVTAMVAAGSPGQIMSLTIGGLQQAPLCNGVAEAAGECGA